jgi:hypothetical protein
MGKSFNQYRSETAIPQQILAQVAPSIFAEEAHTSRSSRYSYISTARILSALASEGFQPFYVAQATPRDSGKREHAKHMVRLRHQTAKAANGLFDELVLVNSHDGTSKCPLIAGQFRMVCANGLIAGNTFSEFCVGHRNTSMDNVLEGVYSVISDISSLHMQIEHMQSHTFSRLDSLDLAQQASKLRWKEDEVQPETSLLLEARRSADLGSDSWSVMNVVQEHLLQGGDLKMKNKTPEAQLHRSRPIHDIYNSVRLNRNIWDLFAYASGAIPASEELY